MKRSLMKMLSLTLMVLIGNLFISCSDDDSSTTPKLTNIEKATEVVEALESGNAAIWEQYVSGEKYIQHNLAFPDGRDAVIGAINNDVLVGTTVDVKRAFSADDLVVLHSEYFLFGKKQVGFDVFRFENNKIVEHWDNLQEIVEETASGRTQLDGPTAITDHAKTAENKSLVQNFVNDILMCAAPEKITEYVSTEMYHQHNPAVADGLDGLGAALEYFEANGLLMQYDTLHKIVAQGNFVLTISEGLFGAGNHTAYYDLFRIEGGKIVEHWDAIETIPAEIEWANTNGKF